MIHSYGHVYAQITGRIPGSRRCFVNQAKSGMKNEISEVFEGVTAFILEFFKIRRGKTSYFFKLVGEMRHTAVIQLVGNFGKVKFVV